MQLKPCQNSPTKHEGWLRFQGYIKLAKLYPIIQGFSATSLLSTSLLYVPEPLFQSINGLFEPPPGSRT